MRPEADMSQELLGGWWREGVCGEESVEVRRSHPTPPWQGSSGNLSHLGALGCF